MGRPTEHGLGKTKTYYSWIEMKRRCLDPNNYNYQNYGGRGIRVCKRWMKFTNFLDDMGMRPDGKSLDRINGKRGYSKRNCRWATSREQIINRSITRWIAFRGETLCLADWALRTGLTSARIAQRIDEQKWSIKDALTQPVNMGARLKFRCAA